MATVDFLTHSLSGALTFFSPFLMRTGKKMFHWGPGGEIFLIQMDCNFPPFST